MPLPTYGVLKGTVIGHLRDADDDHYQILLRAGQTLHRVAVNVKSSAPNAPSTVLFQSSTQLPADWCARLQALGTGFRKLPHKAGGLAIDYLRGGLFKPATLKPVPPDLPGEANDLKDLVEAATVKAMAQEGAQLHAFGARWGPEPGRKDRYFGFTPGNGLHDIHMNQGNSGAYAADNGPWQDGALVFHYPDGRWRAFFFAFQGQRLDLP